MKSTNVIKQGLEKFRSDGIAIYERRDELVVDPFIFKNKYHSWFQQAREVVKCFLPRNYEEFNNLYGNPDDLGNGLGFSLAYFFKYHVSISQRYRDSNWNLRVDTGKDFFSSQIAIAITD